MPLIRAPAAVPDVAPPESPDTLLARLGSQDVDERRHAARDLAREPETAPALAAHLLGERSPVVRDAVFRSLVEIGGEQAAELLAGLLRNADAGLRSGAVEGLKQLELDAEPVLDTLLVDADPDVRLLAIEVTRAWPTAMAIPRLRSLIESDPHVNVCGAAVDVATEVGTSDLLGPLAKLRARFPDDTFLLFAIDLARDRINAANDREA